MAGDTRSVEERLTELQNVVTRLFTYMDSWRANQDRANQPYLGGELPEFGPWMDTESCCARVIAVRTDTHGTFQFATLKLLHDCSTDRRPKWIKDALLDLRNPQWEAEFKRAQNYNLMACLRVDPDGRVVGIEVMFPGRRSGAQTKTD